MSNVFVTRMPAGIPGAISRAGAPTTLEPNIISTATPPTLYGVPVALNANGHVRQIQAGDSAAAVYGFLVRPYPTNSSQQGVGAATPPTSGMCDVMKRGYMSVIVNGAAAAAKDAPAYVRVGNASSGKPLGGIEAGADTAVTSAAGANAGNGTIGSLSATAAALAGDYKVVMLSATSFSVTDPNNNRLADGATGTAYSAEGVGFTVTAGATAFAAGDNFTLSVAQNTVAVPGALFTGPADANGISEIAFN